MCDKGFLLKEGLSASYNTIHTVLLEKENKSFDTTAGKLEFREEELKQKDTLGTNTVSEGEKVQALTMTDARVKNRKGKKGLCHFCKKQVHLKSDCFSNFDVNN